MIENVEEWMLEPDAGSIAEEVQAQIREFEKHRDWWEYSLILILEKRLFDKGSEEGLTVRILNRLLNGKYKD